MTTIKSQNNKFRVIGQVLDTHWLFDSHENRKILLIVLRWLRDKQGNPIFTFQQLAKIIHSENRQAASKYIERFNRLDHNLKATLDNDPHIRLDNQLRVVVLETIKQYPLATQERLAQFAELKNKGYTPKIIITDGWNAYPSAIKRVYPKAIHLLCVFHSVHSVFRRLRKNNVFDQSICCMIGKIV